MAFDKSGTLVVRAFTAGGALPVVGTVVKISGVDEDNRGVEYSVITDVDGVTGKISLPAPSGRLSLSPRAPLPAYALYNIEISAPGYYTKRIFNVAVFDSTETIQPVNMIPRSNTENRITYPRDNLNTLVYENERLE